MPAPALLPTVTRSILALLCAMGGVCAHGAANGAEVPAQPPEKPATTSKIFGSPLGADMGTRGFHRALFAAVDLYAAASSGPEGISFTGHLRVDSIGPTCAGRVVRFSRSDVVRAIPTIGEEPSVAVLNQRYCVTVSAENPPLALVGQSYGLTRVGLSEFVNGEEYSSPDPDQLQAAGISLFIPGINEGRYLAVFVLSGLLEMPDGSAQQYHTAAASAVFWGQEKLTDQRLLMTLISPAGTQVNIAAVAPVAAETTTSATAPPAR